MRNSNNHKTNFCNIYIKELQHQHLIDRFILFFKKFLYFSSLFFILRFFLVAETKTAPINVVANIMFVYFSLCLRETTSLSRQKNNRPRKVKYRECPHVCSSGNIDFVRMLRLTDARVQFGNFNVADQRTCNSLLCPQSTVSKCIFIDKNASAAHSRLYSTNMLILRARKNLIKYFYMFFFSNLIVLMLVLHDVYPFFKLLIWERKLYFEAVILYFIGIIGINIFFYRITV